MAQKKNKILLREHHWKVGLVFKVVNRFYPDKDWEIVQVVELDMENDVARLKILDYHNEFREVKLEAFKHNGTRTMFTHPSVHCKHDSAWISYYMPGGDILYGGSKC